MQHSLAQIAAIARTEFRLARRGKVLIVIVGALLAMSVLYALTLTNTLPPNIPKSEISEAATKVIIFLTWSPLGITLALVLPLVVIDIIPKDQLYHVRELLDSTPLPVWVYLMGKVLGTWLTYLVGIGVVLLFNAVLWRVRVGEFAPLPYLEMSIFGAAALIVLNTGLSVLITATLSTRRQAFGLVLMLLVVLPFLFGFERVFSATDAIGLASPVRGVIINTFLGIEGFEQHLFAAIAVGIGELILVGLVMWGVITWQYKRV